MKLAMTLGVTTSLALSGLAQAATICRAGPPDATSMLADASTGAPVLNALGKQIPCDLPEAQNGVQGTEGSLGSTTGLSTTTMVVGGVALAGAIAGGVVAGTSGQSGNGKGGCKLVPISGGAVCM